MAAIAALQLALQPAAGSSAPPAALIAAAPTAAVPGVTGSASATAGPARGAEPADPEAGAAAAGEAQAPDADGKRRRLRRKRAASPDSAHSADGSAEAAAEPTQDPGSAGSSAGSGAAATATVEAAAAGPEAAGSDGTACASDAAADGKQDGGGLKPSLVQRVTRQVAKLSLQAQPRRGTAAPAAPSSPDGSTGEAPAAAEPPVQHAGSCCEGNEGGGTAAEAAPQAVLQAAPQVQRGLLDSLSLVHDLSQVRWSDVGGGQATCRRGSRRVPHVWLFA